MNFIFKDEDSKGKLKSLISENKLKLGNAILERMFL